MVRELLQTADRVCAVGPSMEEPCLGRSAQDVRSKGDISMAFHHLRHEAVDRLAIGKRGHEFVLATHSKRRRRGQFDVMNASSRLGRR